MIRNNEWVDLVLTLSGAFGHICSGRATPHFKNRLLAFESIGGGQAFTSSLMTLESEGMGGQVDFEVQGGEKARPPWLAD